MASENIFQMAQDSNWWNPKKKLFVLHMLMLPNQEHPWASSDVPGEFSIY